jgi:hypothetical protein
MVCSWRPRSFEYVTDGQTDDGMDDGRIQGKLHFIPTFFNIYNNNLQSGIGDPDRWFGLILLSCNLLLAASYGMES